MFPSCPRFPRLLPLQKWSTVVGRHQNWMSRAAVNRVIFSRLLARYTRFLLISLIYRRYSRICAYKMFNHRSPYDWNSSAEDRSKLPRRIGRLMHKYWNKLWEILEVCWSADPLDRPTASDLEARLRKIFQPLSWFRKLYPILWYCIKYICYKPKEKSPSTVVQSHCRPL